MEKAKNPLDNSGNSGEAITEYFKFIFKKYSPIEIWFYFYIGLILIWFVKVLMHLIRSSRSKLLHELHKATDDNDIHKIFEIVSKNPKLINTPLDKEGFTPFLRACYNGNTEVVKLLLGFGADIESQTARGENAFYLAAYNRIKHITQKDARCIQTLYYAGVDMNKPNSNGLNALQLASKYGHLGLYLWLINKGANPLVEPNPSVLAKRAGFDEISSLIKKHRKVL